MSRRVGVVVALLALIGIVLAGFVVVLVPGTNRAPIASFTSSCTGLACSFNAKSSTDPEGSALDYSWNFLDGSTGSGPAPQHVYSEAWAFGAILTVTDDKGAQSSKWSRVSPSARSELSASDAFSRKELDGWGIADKGGSWKTIGEPGTFAVTGNVGTMVLAQPGSGPYALLDTISSTATDVQLTAALDKLPAGNGAYISVLGRRVEGAGDYRAKVHVLDSGQVAISIQRTSSKGKETPLTAAKVIWNLTTTPKQGLRVRLQATGTDPTTLRARAWPTSGIEPDEWAVTAKDSNASLQRAGSVGAQVYLSASADRAPLKVEFDDLRAEQVG